MLLKKKIFLKTLCIWKGELQRQRNRQKETFHPLIVSPSGCLGQRWASLQPGARRFFLVYHIGEGARTLRPFSVVFLSTLARAWIGGEVVGLELACIWDVDTADGSLIRYTTEPAPWMTVNSSINCRLFREFIDTITTLRNVLRRALQKAHGISQLKDHFSTKAFLNPCLVFSWSLFFFYDLFPPWYNFIDQTILLSICPFIQSILPHPSLFFPTLLQHYSSSATITSPI